MVNMKLSFVVVDSRSDKHPGWVAKCIQSIKNQTEDVELIIVNNLNRKNSIGKCYNHGAAEATGDWVVFVGDDDYVARDYAYVLRKYIESGDVRNKRVVNVTTGMTAFNDETGQKSILPRQSTGAWERNYLLKHLFNENLEKGIDREYGEETVKRGDLILYIEYYFGYFYRKHGDYSCAGEITFISKPSDIYFITGNKNFLKPIVEQIEKKKSVFVDNRLNIKLADKAKFIWVEFANEVAVEVANYQTNAKKILRVHAYEAFNESAKYIDYNKYDYVIFVSEYIKQYTENRYGKIKNPIVIPNGIDINSFVIPKNKQINKNIAYAGYLTRKKGIGEIVMLAHLFPEYQFFTAGKFQEDDVADWLQKKKPDNLHIEKWQYDLNEWFKDKTYILNASIRESHGVSICEAMAAGLKPLVYNWLGSEDIYGKENIWCNPADFKKLLEEEIMPEKYRKIVIDKFSFNKIYNQIKEIING